MMLYHFTFPPAVYEPYSCSISSSTSSVFYILAILMNVHWYCIVFLICVFLMTKELEHLLLWSMYLLRGRGCLKNFLPILIPLFSYQFWEIYISWIQVLLVLSHVPETWKGQNSNYQFGVRRGSLVKKVPTKKTGNLIPKSILRSKL